MNSKDQAKPQPDPETPHMEAQNLPEPMEEFVTDQSVPSQSMQAGDREHGAEVAPPGGDVKKAVHGQSSTVAGQ